MIKNSTQIRGDVDYRKLLSPRRLETVRLIASGYSLKESAHEMDISVKTAEHHWTEAKIITGWRTPVHAAHFCLRYEDVPFIA